MTCTTCADLLNEALNLTVRGRTLDGIQRRADTLAASRDPEGWQASGRFDDHIAHNNLTRDPWQQIEHRSLTPQLWAEDQFRHIMTGKLFSLDPAQADLLTGADADKVLLIGFPRNPHPRQLGRRHDAAARFSNTVNGD